MPFHIREYWDPSRPTLNFIVPFRGNGGRKRKFFTAKRDAENFTRNRTLAFQAQGHEGAEFPSWLRLMADECNVRPEPHGKTIKDATDHFMAILEASARNGTVTELVTELLKAKETDGATALHASRRPSPSRTPRL